MLQVEKSARLFADMSRKAENLSVYLKAIEKQYFETVSKAMQTQSDDESLDALAPFVDLMRLEISIRDQIENLQNAINAYESSIKFD